MEFIKKNWLILLILATSLVVRLYRLPATMTFLEDEGRDLLVVKRMLDTGKPALLGPQTSTGNMYLGPAYYYFITPALLLSGMSPLGPAALIAVTGVATVWLLYYLGKRWFDQPTGLVAAVLYAVMPLPVVFTRNSWNPNLAPLVSLLCVWMVVNIVGQSKHKHRSYLALGALVGLLVQLHYMALLFVAALGLTLLFYHRWRLSQLFLGSLLALFTFTLTLTPFIIFELRNQFVNTKAITRFVEAKEEHNIRYELPFWLWRDKVAGSTTRLFSSAFGRDALTPDPYRSAVSLGVVAVIALAAYRRRKEKIFHSLLLLLIIPLLMLGIYQENVHLHYLGFLFPLCYLLFSASPKSFLFALAFMVYALPQSFSYLSSGDTNQLIRAQEVAKMISDQAGAEPYNMVSAEGSPAAPYLYFAALSDHPPTTEFASLLFLICQGQECGKSDIETPFLYITGPAHPTLTSYLGHPLYNYFEGARRVLSNDHVSHGTWVAKIEVEQKEP